MTITWDDVNEYARLAARKIRLMTHTRGETHANIYGVPNGGIYAAMAIQGLIRITPTMDPYVGCTIVERPELADFIVDDLIDSGSTQDRYIKKYAVPFIALIDKHKPIDKTLLDESIWISFPWERAKNDTGVEENITRILQHIGEDPKREGLVETPKRVAKSYAELFSGYNQKPEDVMKVFTEGACDEMVLLKGIEFQSMCEHHMLPFLGKADIGYIPNGKIIGISKLARLLEIYSRRLQVQERMTQQITKALDEHLQPKGSACVIQARHLCIACRGVQKQHSEMVTSSLTGVFRKPEVRAEFFTLTGR